MVLLYTRRRRNVLAALLIIAMGSFVLCEFVVRREASAAFYLIPTRMWELLLGACVALSASRSAIWRGVREPLGILGLAAICASFLLVDRSMRFPGVSASLACIGTAMAIRSGEHGESRVSRFLSWQPFQWTGRISYSLYLWHWPVLVFAQYWMLEPLGPWRSWAAIAVSVALSDLSYRFVEQPFRTRSLPTRNQLFTAVAAISSLLIAVGAWFWMTQGAPWRFPAFAEAPTIAIEAQDPREGVCALGPDQDAVIWSPSLCKFADGAGSPVFLWGDSHAFHLRHGIEALAAQFGHPVYLFASSACPPIMNVEVPDRPKCRDNNKFALDFLRRAGIKTVILAANWDFAVHLNKASLEALPSTLRELDAMGIEAWVVGQLPIYALQNPQFLSYRLKAGNYSQASYSIPPRGGENVNNFLKSIVPPHQFIDVYDLFCAGGRCTIFQNNQLMVVDSAHLSPAGSTFVVKELVARGAFGK